MSDYDANSAAAELLDSCGIVICDKDHVGGKCFTSYHYEQGDAREKAAYSALCTAYMAGSSAMQYMAVTSLRELASEHGYSGNPARGCAVLDASGAIASLPNSIPGNDLLFYCSDCGGTENGITYHNLCVECRLRIRAAEEKSKESKPSRGMTRGNDVSPGLYIITWVSGGTSEASVGCDSAGRRWYSPINWVTVPSFEWERIESVERIGAPAKSLVAAGDISRGECFRKPSGDYVYLKLSNSSIKFCGLDVDKVYGVCFNGNVCRLKPSHLVVPAELEDMVKNLGSDDAR